MKNKTLYVWAFDYTAPHLFGPDVHHPFRSLREDGIYTTVLNGEYSSDTNLAIIQTTTIAKMKKALGKLKKYSAGFHLCNNIKDELKLVNRVTVHSSRSEPITF